LNILLRLVTAAYLFQKACQGGLSRWPIQGVTDVFEFDTIKEALNAPGYSVGHHD
jgi:hypothetical protein